MKFIALVAMLLVGLVQAEVKETFEDHYYNKYESGQCGSNILAFAQHLYLDGELDDDSEILQISNKGYTVFGLVNVEWAREGGSRNPEYPESGFYFLAGERNWYHHVIIRIGEKIYDFDYGNTPVADSVEEYFEKMFFDEKEPKIPSHKVGREEKLKSYEIKSISAVDSVMYRLKEGEKPGELLERLGEYLEKF